MTKRFYHRYGDYYIDGCDICGTRCWASEATKLPVETGKGGLLVCPSCVDAVDYGTVPYKIPAERPVPTVRDAISTYSQTYDPFDADTTNPMTNRDLPPAAEPEEDAGTWSELQTVAWNNISTLWENMTS